MGRLVASIRAWLRGWTHADRVELPDVSRVRVRVPRSVMHALRRATTPTPQNHEPLAFLRVRYASEARNAVIVGFGVIPFRQTAYVDGYAGANFDTGYVVEIANVEIISNGGLLLVHQHGGRGKPAFSRTDLETNRDVMLRLTVDVPMAPYGALVLGDQQTTAVVAWDGRLVDAEVLVVPDALGSTGLSA